MTDNKTITNEEIMEHLLVIYQSLERLTFAVKLLLDESIQKENDERNRYGHTIFDETDDVIEKFNRDCQEFFDGVMKHGKTVE